MHKLTDHRKGGLQLVPLSPLVLQVLLILHLQLRFSIYRIDTPLPSCQSTSRRSLSSPLYQEYYSTIESHLFVVLCPVTDNVEVTVPSGIHCSRMRSYTWAETYILFLPQEESTNCLRNHGCSLGCSRRQYCIFELRGAHSYRLRRS